MSDRYERLITDLDAANAHYRVIDLNTNDYVRVARPRVAKVSDRA